MKKYLIPKDGQFYKANLHCHSTVSDGMLSPEKLKKLYKENGYSVLCYTDHDVLISHSELSDEDFLALNGYEMEINDTNPDILWRNLKTCHICLIALDEDNLTQVCWHRSKYLYKNAVKYADKVQFDESLPDYEREYTHECISDIMKKGREGGFFVTYNHPNWSLENYSDYMGYNNMHAMEICNGDGQSIGFCEYNEKEYDDMLRGGKKVYCIGSDDNHNIIDDNFIAWTMIKAEKLEYKTITNALTDGNFYASCGPEIYELWFEDGRINIICSDVEKLVFHTDSRNAGIIDISKNFALDEAMFEVFEENGKKKVKASFEVNKMDVYIRLTIIDEKGRHANTNAYYIEDLYK